MLKRYIHISIATLFRPAYSKNVLEMFSWSILHCRMIHFLLCNFTLKWKMGFLSQIVLPCAYRGRLLSQWIYWRKDFHCRHLYNICLFRNHFVVFSQACHQCATNYPQNPPWLYTDMDFLLIPPYPWLETITKWQIIKTFLYTWIFWGNSTHFWNATSIHMESDHSSYTRVKCLREQEVVTHLWASNISAQTRVKVNHKLKSI